MKPPEIDIYRSAKLLITELGEDAEIEAAMKADMCLAKGDVEGQSVWIKIVRAIRDLQAREPEGSVH